MLLTIIVFLLLLSVLIFVHEFGHFQAARFFGIRVEEFGFGFPPRLFGYERRGTRYSINWIPFGGFVKLKGETGGEKQEDADSFSAQSSWRRLVVLASGVLMNVACGVLLYAVLFGMGLDAPVEMAGRFARITDRRIIVADVIQNAPAGQAGIVRNDVLLSVDAIMIKEIPAFQSYIQEKMAVPVSLVIERGKDQLTIMVTPEYLPGEKKGGLGIYMEDRAWITYPWYVVPFKAIEASIAVLWQTVLALVSLLFSLLRAQPLAFEVSGPVGIAVMTKSVLALGVRHFLEFSAVISLNLALMNILPIPALDGGRVFFLLIEKIRGKMISPRIEHLTHTISFLVLVLLMVVVTYYDVIKLFQ